MHKTQRTLIEKCNRCKEEYQLEVYEEDYIAWLNGKLHLQDALPYVPADSRELLISGMCGKCFVKIF